MTNAPQSHAGPSADARTPTLIEWCKAKAAELHEDAGADYQEGGSGRASWIEGNRFLETAAILQAAASASTDARTTHAALIEEAKAARRHCDHTRRTCKEVGCDYDLIDRLATALAASERALRAAHDGDRRYAALEQANTKLAGLLDAANGTIAQLRAEREARDEAAASDSKLLDDIEAMPGMEVSQHLGNHTGVVHWRFGSTRGSLRDRVRAALDLATPTPEADHA